MEVLFFAQSAMGLPIYSWNVSGQESQDRPLLILGGVHGNEPEGVLAAWYLLEELRNKKLPHPVVVIPQFNPDGLLAGSRLNGNSVDLNRNLPTKDWSKDAFSPKYPPGNFANSEPENQALVSWIESENPRFVLSLHSFEKTLMNINGDCRKIAEVMHEMNQLPIEESMGYPTPGCLGTYAGLERNSPTITYEIKRGMSAEEIRGLHLPALWKGLENVV